MSIQPSTLSSLPGIYELLKFSKIHTPEFPSEVDLQQDNNSLTMFFNGASSTADELSINPIRFVHVDWKAELYMGSPNKIIITYQNGIDQATYIQKIDNGHI